MRLILKALLVTLLVTLTVGPLAAAPMSLTTGAHLTTAGPASSGSPIASTLGYVLGIVAFGITIKKDTGAIAQKFVTRAQAATPDYQSGVTGAGQSWEAGAKAGEPNYEQGVQGAIARKAFGKGVSGKSAKYEHNATTLGPQRYSQGVGNAQDAYAAGMQPVINTLKGLSLPPAGPRGSAANQTRANAVATALNKMRTGK